MDSLLPIPAPGGADSVPPAPVPAVISGFWRRVLALILDSILLGLVGALLGVFLFDFFASLGAWGRLLGFCIAVSYFGILNSSLGNGQSVGKRIAKIRVVDREGSTIALSRSLFRYVLLDVGFFLNGLLLPASIISSPVSTILSLIVFGWSGAIVYLYIFNRKTRQSAHDLVVGTYVVETLPKGRVEAPSVWRGHFAVLGVYLVCLIVLLTIVIPRLGQMGPFPELLTVVEAVQKSPDVVTSNVFAGKTWGSQGETTTMVITVVWKGRPRDYEKAADQIAALALQADPAILRRNVLTISIVYGYDIGIARVWRSNSFGYAPQQWQERLSKSPQETKQTLRFPVPPRHVFTSL